MSGRRVANIVRSARTVAGWMSGVSTGVTITACTPGRSAAFRPAIVDES